MSTRRLRILNIVCEGAPGGVQSAMERVAGEHFPTIHDDEAYQAALRSAGGEKELIRARTKMRERDSDPSGHDFTSIAGWVFAKGRVKHSSNLARCPVMDWRFVDRAGVSDEYRGWFDFESVSAYPVYERGLDDKVVGVLMAFKTARNGFRSYDRNTLALAVHLLENIV